MSPNNIQVIRFLCIGALNTLFGFTIYSLLIMLGFSLSAAIIVSTIAGVLFNFLTYGKFVFMNLSKTVFPKFILFYMFLTSINYALLLGLKGIGLGPIFSQLILLPAITSFGYFGMKKIVYNS